MTLATGSLFIWPMYKIHHIRIVVAVWGGWLLTRQDVDYAKWSVTQQQQQRQAGLAQSHVLGRQRRLQTSAPCLHPSACLFLLLQIKIYSFCLYSQPVDGDVLLKEHTSQKTAKHETPLSSVTVKLIFSILGEWSGTRNTERNAKENAAYSHSLTSAELVSYR